MPGFPDLKNGNLMIGVRPGSVSINGQQISVSSTTFQSAMSACRRYTPRGKPPSAAQIAAMRAKLLQFAQCVRTHGVSTFPDPTVTSQGQVRMMLPHSMNPNAPALQAAFKACRGLAPLPPLAKPAS